MIKFDVYVQRKEGKVIKFQRLEWNFNRITDCLHYAIDKFDRKTEHSLKAYWNEWVKVYR